MKPLPKVDLSFEPLMRMFYGAIPFNLLMTAIELKVFSNLTEPMSADLLAERIGSNPRNTRLFMDGLVANDLLHKRDGRYWNAAIADKFLVEGTPTYIGHVLMNLREYSRTALEDMTTLVREGDAPSRGFQDPSLREHETEMYGNFQRAGRAQQVAEIVGRLPEFAHMKKMLDLGGGAGLIGVAIVAAHPTMTGVIFDKPDTVETARRFIQEYDLEDRVSVIGGDFTRDSLGEGYDLVWTSFALWRHNFEAMLRRAHAALNPGGLCISLAEGMTDEGTQPTMTVNAMMSCVLEGHCPYEFGEIGQAMLRAGFKNVYTQTVYRLQTHGPGVLDIGRR